MYKRKFHIIYFLFLIWNLSFSQQLTNYTIKDGLPSNHVYKMVQDTKGFLWTITDNGIVRFNGSEFKVFTTKDGLPTNDIWDITTTPDGKIWYFCKASKIGYIENDIVYAFEAKEKGINFFPLKIITYDSSVIFRSGSHLYFLNTNKQWESIEASKVYDFTNEYVQKAIQTHNKVEEILQKTSTIHYREKDSIAFWLTKDYYYVLNTKTGKLIKEKAHFDTKNNFSTYARIHNFNGQFQISDTNFLVILNQQFKISESIPIPTNLKSHYAFKDKSDNLWIATFSNGVYKIPEIHRKVAYAFPSKKVNSITKVRGKIIANVFDVGYCYYDKNKKQFTPYIKKEGHSYSPCEIDSLESIFFINNLKLYKEQYNANNQIVVEQEKNLFESVKQIVYFDKYLWGLGVLDLKKMDINTYEVIDRYDYIGINTLLVFNNNLYLGTSNGLKKFEDEKIANLKQDEMLFQFPILNLIPIDNKWILVCTDGHGAYATDFSKTVFLEDSNFLSVKDAAIYNDEIWLATNVGLYLFHRRQNKFKLIKKITEEQGLPKRKINSVLLEDNLVYTATDNGVAIFDKNNTSPSQLLKVYIDDVFYNGQNITEKNPSLTFTKDNSINIKIATINFSEMETPIAYNYKLSPIQKEWNETTSRTLNFNDLSPNSYSLQIKLKDYETSYFFTITPLWWQKTITKIVFLVLAILGIGFILYQVRKLELAKKTSKITAQKKLAEFKLYALRSQMNPHFVFNSLAAIQYYINNNDFETSEKYLVKFSKLIRQFFELSKENEITLAEEIKLLHTYLDIEKLRFKEKLNFNFAIDSSINLDTCKIPTMLIQPIVENAVNHGIFNKNEQGNIHINFEKNQENKIIIEVKDDGVGMEATKKLINGKTNSSEILKERLSYLNESKKWEITYANFLAFPDNAFVGNISRFTIKNLE
ncbi:MAG: hypothetical protein COW66_00015 [Flavobacteriaceae bacterium CG18_big_fil_WC_8_21_14_2_50_34_36]|nr:hypothetical protein [Flavobacteriales bacterium]PIQ19649.1 MAG: hypothetical protein COW66_00015 [Flavobacteriaceae bacterium CG18_big_fil_WC_8_21_14_2_50_34_36]